MGFFNKKLEEYSENLRGKTCAVIGVGISNIPLINFLLERGAKVVARDKKPLSEIAENKSLDIPALSEKGVEFITGENYLEGLCEDIIFKTPGLRADRPELLKAYENGAVVTSEMELFLDLCPSTIIAITGSDGKTTTTTLTAKILENAGHRVFLGGNIGRPLLCDVPLMTPEDFCVLELSSFQLHSVAVNPDGTEKENITRFPDVAVVTNVSPNHLDWHTSYDEYVWSKKAIFENLREGGKFVTNANNPETSAFAQEAAKKGKKVCLFSAYKKTDGYFADVQNVYKNGKALFSRNDIKLPGTHNVENYMAAIAATEDFVSLPDVLAVARSFGGVEHRLEYVAQTDGITFYNSSIDSSPSRTVAAIAAFPEADRKKLVLIMGGYDKNIPYAPVGEPVCRMARGVFLCGATAEKIREAIVSSPNYDSTTEIFLCDDFCEAVYQAGRFAKSGDKVILTPASASFDRFKNFEERGRVFKKAVMEFCESDKRNDK